jgi:hypothetical protein
VTRTARDTNPQSTDRGRDPNPVNAHVHLPPNFSAFDDVAAVVERAHEEGLVALGASNYFDFRIYDRFSRACDSAGITPLFGTEIIALQEDLQADGILVNDPDNPGRTYVCGKGIVAYETPNPVASSLLDKIRFSSEARMIEMSIRLADLARSAGIEDPPTIAGIVADVAAECDVPPEWVSLQERHLARALQEKVDALGPDERHTVLGSLLGDTVTASVAADPTTLQNAIRSKLMKAGRPAFVPDAEVSFDDAYLLVRELGGIPCYPILADGAEPVCPFEDPPEALARALLDQGIYCAELIPTRNTPEVVDLYVSALRDVGILVLAGTEHNTRRMIPLTPACRGGASLSGMARTAFWEATCVVAAHQHLRQMGRPGYVDAEGRLASGFADGETRIRWFSELGEQVIAAAQGTGGLA